MPPVEASIAGPFGRARQRITRCIEGDDLIATGRTGGKPLRIRKILVTRVTIGQGTTKLQIVGRDNGGFKFTTVDFGVCSILQYEIRAVRKP